MAQLEVSKSVLLGTCLGDATIQKSNENGNARIRVGHSSDKIEYLHWKKNHLLNIVPITCEQTIIGGKYKKSPNDYTFFQSRRTETITDYYNSFYFKGRKGITKEIIEKVDDVSFAVWIMDDGSFDKDKDILNYTLHTNAFDEEENKIISVVLNEKYGLHSKPVLYPSVNKWLIRFPKKDSLKISKIIEETVIQVDCMKYKLASNYF